MVGSAAYGEAGAEMVFTSTSITGCLDKVPSHSLKEAGELGGKR